MFNTVKIGAVDVPMLSMASVDLYYRNIFHDDPIKLQTQETQNDGDLINFVMRMGFVMAKFAEVKDRKGMAKISQDDFLDWMDGFERNDLLNALPDIRRTYEGQSVTNASAKKNNDEPTEE